MISLEYKDLTFIPAMTNRTKFVAYPSKDSFVVILHFNEEISLRLQGNEQITDEFVDKAFQETQLMNLKRSMKPN